MILGWSSLGAAYRLLGILSGPWRGTPSTPTAPHNPIQEELIPGTLGAVRSLPQHHGQHPCAAFCPTTQFIKLFIFWPPFTPLGSSLGLLRLATLTSFGSQTPQAHICFPEHSLCCSPCLGGRLLSPSPSHPSSLPVAVASSKRPSFLHASQLGPLPHPRLCAFCVSFVEISAVSITLSVCWQVMISFPMRRSVPPGLDLSCNEHT